MSDVKIVELEQKINDLSNKIEDLTNIIKTIFGDQVLINGRFIDIKQLYEKENENGKSNNRY